MAFTAEQQEPGWCPLTGPREFKSGLQAWQKYGQHRFKISQRTFLTYVGKDKECQPREDKLLHVQDIEFIAQSKAWPPAPSFVRGAQKGGEGEAPLDDIGLEIQREKLLKARLEREDLELNIAEKRKRLIPVKEVEQMLAAAAAVVGNEAETFVYDNVREIIHECEGNPEKEDSLRESLLGKVKNWLHAFSRSATWEVEFLDDEDTDPPAVSSSCPIAEEAPDGDDHAASNTD